MNKAFLFKLLSDPELQKQKEAALERAKEIGAGNYDAMLTWSDRVHAKALCGKRLLNQCNHQVTREKASLKSRFHFLARMYPVVNFCLDVFRKQQKGRLK